MQFINRISTYTSAVIKHPSPTMSYLSSRCRWDNGSMGKVISPGSTDRRQMSLFVLLSIGESFTGNIWLYRYGIHWILAAMGWCTVLIPRKWIRVKIQTSWFYNLLVAELCKRHDQGSFPGRILPCFLGSYSMAACTIDRFLWLHASNSQR